MKLVFLMSGVFVIVVNLVSAVAWSQVPPDRARRIEQACPGEPLAKPQQSRRVLIFNTPPHLMAKDPHKGYCIPYAALALETLGKKTGAYEPVVSDDLAKLLPENISQFAAIVLNNTSQNWITPTAQQAASDAMRKHGQDADQIEQVLRRSLLNFVRQGGGLMAIHYAIGANRQWPEFAQLLGPATTATRGTKRWGSGSTSRTIRWCRRLVATRFG